MSQDDFAHKQVLTIDSFRPTAGLQLALNLPSSFERFLPESVRGSRTQYSHSWGTFQVGDAAGAIAQSFGPIACLQRSGALESGNRNLWGLPDFVPV